MLFEDDEEEALVGPAMLAEGDELLLAHAHGDGDEVRGTLPGSPPASHLCCHDLVAEPSSAWLHGDDWVAELAAIPQSCGS